MTTAWAGVDLAAEAERTAIAVLEPAGDGLRLRELVLGASDAELVRVVEASTRTGVDVPFGWPEPFLATILAHQHGRLEAPESTGRDWRRDRAMRTTDYAVHVRTGLWPLSVSTDRIGLPALRWAGISARLDACGVDTARDGSGRVAEVYPAAALACWGFAPRGYKGRTGAARRELLVQELVRAWPWLDWGGQEVACRDSDDLLDAVLSALVAREVDRGRTARPGPDQVSFAGREGWVHLPGRIRPGTGTASPSPPARRAPSPRRSTSPSPRR